MKRAVFSAAAILPLFILVVAASAQTSGTSGVLLASAQPTVLSAPIAGSAAAVPKNGSDTNLLAMARSSQFDIQLQALAAVDAMVASGRISAGQKQTAYGALAALALSGIRNSVIEGMTVVNNYPSVRMHAARLLGRLGGSQAEATLIQVLMFDDEPMVLSEAAFQLGRIASSQDTEALDAIVSAFRREDAIQPQNNMAYASLLSFEKIEKRGGGIQDPAVFDLISRIQQSDYTYAVKAKAAQVFSLLRSNN
ncbi:MAG TPA: HEAT repeat domain-containing protein [Spirochaetia bacterium]|nr:HEAT repeat domain-containing protein [Spirochaetia bacterium]